MATRLIWLVLALVAGAGLDQWSKHWAAHSLATFEHPMPLLIDGPLAGKSVDQVLASKFPALSERARRDLRLNHVRLLLPMPLTETQPMPTRTHLYVFARQRLDQAPRYLYYNRPALLTGVFRDWLGLSQTQSNGAVARIAKGETVAKVLLESIHGVGKGRVGTLAKRYCYTLFPAVLSKTHAVKKGQLLLVMARSVPVVEDFWHFSYAENPGAAWDFLASADARTRLLLFSSVSIIALLVLIVLFVRIGAGHRLVSAGLMLVGGGAIGNLIDRLRFNYVVDFIQWHWYTKAYWPTFNVADVLIVLGVGMLIADMLFNRDSVLLRRSLAERPITGNADG